MSWLSKTFKKLIRGIGRLGGNDKYGNYSAWGMSPSMKSLEKMASEERAKAEARAHADEVNALGAKAQEEMKRRRRKGLYSTVLTGSSPGMGSPPSSTGSSTLGG